MPVANRMHATPTLDAKRERYLLLTLAGIHFSHILDFMIVMPLGPILMQTFGVGTHEFGLLVSAYTFTAAASGLLAATFVDRFERKRLLLVMLALFGLATLACGLAPGYAALLAARGLAGAFGGVMGAMVHTMVGDLIPFERRARANGTIMAAFSLSTVAGVPFSLYLANHFGWQAPFLLIAVLTLGLLILGWRALPQVHGHLSVRAEVKTPHFLSDILAVLRDPNHLRALMLMLLIMFSGFTVIPFITVYAVANVGIAQHDIPLVYLAGGAATLVTARLIGHWADALGKIKVYRFVALCSILPLFMVTHLGRSPLWLWISFTTLFFVLVSGRMIPAMAIVTSAAQAKLRGTFLSINAAVQQLGSGLAAYIGGLMIAQSGSGMVIHYDWVGYVAISATLLAILFVGRIEMHTG